MSVGQQKIILPDRATRLAQGGLAIRAEHASLSEHPLAWDELTNFTIDDEAGNHYFYVGCL